MRAFVVICTFCMICAESSIAQSKKVSWEVSFSGSFRESTERQEVNGTVDSFAGSYFSLALRSGFFLSGPLEIEPEVLWTAGRAMKPAFALSGNVSYNLVASRSYKIIVFPLIGIGVSNGLPVAGYPSLYRSSGKVNITLVNMGVGTKMLVTEKVAIRIEYRYQQYRGSMDQGTFTCRCQNVFFGFSVLL